MFKLKKCFSLWLSLLVIFSLTATPLFTRASYNQATALSYLQSHSSSAWSTLGLIALNSGSIPYEHLKNISASSVIEYETPILAISALGMDANNFYGQDYVTRLKSFYSGRQLGDPTTLNDDIFGLLALTAAGIPQTDEVIVNTKNFITSNQNSDGGWSYTVGGPSDSNMTAAAIAALAAFGASPNDADIQNSLNYLRTAQNSDGGFTYDPKSAYGTASDSSSTAWVLWALNSLNINHESWTKDGHTPDDYLASTQAQDGYFEYQTGAGENSFSPITTAYAVIALAGKTLPLTAQKMTIQSFGFRIEGSSEEICAGKTQGPTALDIVKNASIQCGFTYHIQQASFGPYLDKINDDQAVGQTGWMYLVNNAYADVGAADYNLKTGEEVVWFFGDYGWQPTRLDLPQTKIENGQNAQATVEYFNGDSWQKLSEAAVIFGTLEEFTNAEGNATLSAPDGYYKVSASKIGYIRSNQTLLQVGDPTTSVVNLTANLDNGQIQGTSTKPNSLSFIVNTSNLNFGNINPGESITKQITISNNGTIALNIESAVSGDRIFLDNLKLNGKTSQKFTTNIGSGQNQDQNLTLSVPAGFDGSGGSKTGQLVFWASEN